MFNSRATNGTNQEKEPIQCRICLENEQTD
jgi:hypothetical protein